MYGGCCEGLGGRTYDVEPASMSTDDMVLKSLGVLVLETEELVVPRWEDVVNLGLMPNALKFGQWDYCGERRQKSSRFVDEARAS